MSEKFILPSAYPFAERVPKAGASCATCAYLGEDEETCTNDYYIDEHGSDARGAKAPRWCCMAWSKEKR